MLTSDKMVALSADMRAYLEYEANRRGIDIELVYNEEKNAQKALDARPFTTEELRTLAAASTPDPRVLEGDEDYPF
jgi:hypothetical protein